MPRWYCRLNLACHEPVQPVYHRGLFGVRRKRAEEGVAHEGGDFRAAVAALLLHRAQQVREIPAGEQGRIVGVDGNAHAGVEQLAQPPEPARAGVAGPECRADGQADIALDQGLDDARVLDRVDAVVDALQAQQVQAFADMDDGILLVDVAMGGQAVAFGARPLEQGGELARRVAPLGRIQPETDDPVAPRPQDIEQGPSLVQWPVAVDTQDQVGGNGPSPAGLHRPRRGCRP